MDSLARFGQSLIAAVQTRLQLIADELEEQGALIARMALLWALAGFCFVLAVLVGAFLLVVLFWDDRVAVLSTLLVILALGGIGAIAKARAIARTRPRAFAATLSELTRDHGALAGTRSKGFAVSRSRRAELLSKAQDDRRGIARELGPLAGALGRVDRGIAALQWLRERPVLVAAAATAGVALAFAGSRRRSPLNLIKLGLSAWQAWRWLNRSRSRA